MFLLFLFLVVVLLATAMAAILDNRIHDQRLPLELRPNRFLCLVQDALLILLLGVLLVLLVLIAWDASALLNFIGVWGCDPC